MSFVPRDFDPPTPPETRDFRLEPLGPQHNEADYAAWTSSMDFIRSLPGWRDSSWPTPMTLDENRADLECHARGFAERTQFCYSVLQPGGGPVVGCVYVKPTVPLHDGTAEVRSWVSAGHAGLDVPLYDAVAAWLRDAWPFDSVEYAAR